MAIRGDDPQRIMARCGHENMATTMGYIREAESLNASPDSAFPVLPPTVVLPPELPQGPKSWGSSGGKLSRSLAKSKRPQRDSNPLEHGNSPAISVVSGASDAAGSAEQPHVTGRNVDFWAAQGLQDHRVPIGSLPCPADAIRPRVAPEASERAGQRLERGLRVARGDTKSDDPEGDVASILEATCGDLGLTAAGAPNPVHLTCGGSPAETWLWCGGDPAAVEGPQPDDMPPNVVLLDDGSEATHLRELATCQDCITCAAEAFASKGLTQ